MLKTGFPFDAVQMPLNPFDANFFSFEQKVLPVLVQRGIAPLAMKPIGGHGEPVQKGVFTARRTPALFHVASRCHDDHRRFGHGNSAAKSEDRAGIYADERSRDAGASRSCQALCRRRPIRAV